METQLYLTPADRGRELALEDFEHARGSPGYRYELIDGKLEVSPEPDLPHDDVADWVGDILRDYKRERADVINRVSSHARVFVPGRRAATCPQPDVAAYQNFPTHLSRRQLRWQDVCPVLVVEVVSEDNQEKDRNRNVRLYALVPSVREYWVIDPLTDPDRPTLTVYRRRGSGWQKPIVVGPGGAYTTRLLPGLTLSIPS